MTEPNTSYSTNPKDQNFAPHITLAGKAWPIPRLTPRQQRIIVPGLLKFGPKINFQVLTTEQYDEFCDIFYTALTKAHPDITRDEFDDMELSPMEFPKALEIIANQTGILKSAGDTPLSGNSAPAHQHRPKI